MPTAKQLYYIKKRYKLIKMIKHLEEDGYVFIPKNEYEHKVLDRFIKAKRTKIFADVGLSLEEAERHHRILDVYPTFTGKQALKSQEATNNIFKEALNNIQGETLNKIVSKLKSIISAYKPPKGKE